MRYRFGAVLALTTILLTISLTAIAAPPIDGGGNVTVGGGFIQDPGTYTLASEPTGNMAGRDCLITAAVTNNESVWPGNTLRVETGNDTLTLDNVEDVSGTDIAGSNQMILGPTIDVILEVADGSSLTAIVTWVCFSPTTTTEPPSDTTTTTSTTIPSSTTTTMTDSTTTSTLGSTTTVPNPSSTSTVPAPSTTVPTPPSTPPELPFTGPEHIALGAVVASILVGGGVRLVRGRWGR